MADGDDEDDETPRTAEYQDGDVIVTSTDPLRGHLELISGDDVVELHLTRYAAETLISVLLEFLAEGEGQDAPNMTFHRQH